MKLPIRESANLLLYKTTPLWNSVRGKKHNKPGDDCELPPWPPKEFTRKPPVLTGSGPPERILPPCCDGGCWPNCPCQCPCPCTSTPPTPNTTKTKKGCRPQPEMIPSQHFCPSLSSPDPPKRTSVPWFQLIVGFFVGTGVVGFLSYVSPHCVGPTDPYKEGKKK